MGKCPSECDGNPVGPVFEAKAGHWNLSWLNSNVLLRVLDYA